MEYSNIVLSRSRLASDREAFVEAGDMSISAGWPAEAGEPAQVGKYIIVCSRA